MSTVVFTAGINNSSSIEDVRLIAQECMNNICFIDSQNISMNYTYSCCMDFYMVEFKLTHEDATQIKYHLEILSNNTWYEYKMGYISLINDNDKTIVDSKENTTPGFEITILGLIIISYIVKKSIRNQEK